MKPSHCIRWKGTLLALSVAMAAPGAAIASLTYSFSAGGAGASYGTAIMASGTVVWNADEGAVTVKVAETSGGRLTAVGMLRPEGEPAVAAFDHSSSNGAPWTLRDPYTLAPGTESDDRRYFGAEVSNAPGYSGIPPGGMLALTFKFAGPQITTFLGQSGANDLWLRFHVMGPYREDSAYMGMSAVPEPAVVISVISAAFIGLMLWRHRARSQKT
jgi:hypothetical protein